MALQRAPVAGTLESLALEDGYAALGDAFVERRDPTPLPDPYLVAFDPDVAALVGLSPEEAGRPEFVRLAAGCARFGAVRSYAAVYAGHQFGSFVPQLGDGRALTLGTVRADGGTYEWQVKGAGPTAFSRFGDGRAVLRSTIREYLCGEAMAALGIPTTRALAIAGSDEAVFRESPETAAVLTRIAPSHVRFGTFEYFHHRGDAASVRALADYVVEHHVAEAAALAGEARYVAFFRDVVLRTARLIAGWQAAGFAHGVMNTDNMSILGLTLDYGPFGFMHRYDPGFVSNHSDEGGRYAFDRQPGIGRWNCRALALALSTLVPAPAAQAIVAEYEPAYRRAYLALLREKFGLARERDGDAALIAACFDRMAETGTPYAAFFRTLCEFSARPAPGDGALPEPLGASDAWRGWTGAYRDRLAHESRDDRSRQAAMRRVNPVVVLRNDLAQRAIADAERGDYGEIARLHAVLRRPYEPTPAALAYADPAGATEGPSVSCSS